MIKLCASERDLAFCETNDYFQRGMEKACFLFKVTNDYFQRGVEKACFLFRVTNDYIFTENEGDYFTLKKDYLLLENLVLL